MYPKTNIYPYYCTPYQVLTTIYPHKKKNSSVTLPSIIQLDAGRRGQKVLNPSRDKNAGRGPQWGGRRRACYVTPDLSHDCCMQEGAGHGSTKKTNGIGQQKKKVLSICCCCCCFCCSADVDGAICRCCCCCSTATHTIHSTIALAINP